MKIAAFHFQALLLAAIPLIGCSNQDVLSSSESTIRSAPSSIPSDPQTRLYTVRGLGGLIDHGDELMVMVYTHSSREAAIRRENVAAAHASLARWIKSAPPPDGLLQIRVPDDRTGARFYYFERSLGKPFTFKAVCAGPWKDDPVTELAICDETIEASSRIISLEYSERALLQHSPQIAAIVMSALAKQRVIDQ